MLKNTAKSNWTLKQLGWELHPKGDISEWDGLTKRFVEIVNDNKQLQDDLYIKRWYDASNNMLKES